MSRPLTKHGLWQAKSMADWLKPQLPKKLDIYVSPALRTLQTVEALNLPYTILPELAPDADPNTLLRVAHWPDHTNAVMIVGHQPTLGMTASIAMTGELQEWPFKKGAIWWINARKRGNDFQAALKVSMAPEMLNPA